MVVTPVFAGKRVGTESLGRGTDRIEALGPTCGPAGSWLWTGRRAVRH